MSNKSVWPRTNRKFNAPKSRMMAATINRNLGRFFVKMKYRTKEFLTVAAFFFACIVDFVGIVLGARTIIGGILSCIGIIALLWVSFSLGIIHERKTNWRKL